MSAFKTFKALHQGSELFLLPNAWDARSAVMFEQSGFKAVGTSSAAVANSLGFEDGENMLFSDYLFVIKRILSVLKVPLTIDIETGYGKTIEEVTENIITMATLGVAGINIEDSTIHQGKRTLQDAKVFADLVAHLKQKLSDKKLELFLNIRTDGYIMNVDGKEQETLKRLQIYSEAGADGVFIPCIVNDGDIDEAVKHSKLPINVMAIQGLPEFSKLNKLGVRRVSMGPFMFHKVYAQIPELTKAIHTLGNVSPIVS